MLKIMLIAFLPTFISSSIYTGATPVFGDASDDFWYVGKDSKINMFMKYTVQDEKYNRIQPFNITLYFRSFNQSSSSWIVPIVVESNGRTTQGTLELQEADMSVSRIIGNSSLGLYQSAYRNSLDWLSAFAIKSDPQTLEKDAYWVSPYCGINDCPHLTVIGSERVRVSKMSVNATRVDLYNSNTTFWIVSDLPFPVKASIDDSSHEDTKLLSFELLEIGMGEPTAVPEFSSSVFIIAVAVVLLCFVSFVKRNHGVGQNQAFGIRKRYISRRC